MMRLVEYGMRAVSSQRFSTTITSNFSLADSPNSLYAEIVNSQVPAGTFALSVSLYIDQKEVTAGVNEVITLPAGSLQLQRFLLPFGNSGKAIHLNEILHQIGSFEPRLNPTQISLYQKFKYVLVEQMFFQLTLIEQSYIYRRRRLNEESVFPEVDSLPFSCAGSISNSLEMNEESI